MPAEWDAILGEALAPQDFSPRSVTALINLCGLFSISDDRPDGDSHSFDQEDRAAEAIRFCQRGDLRQRGAAAFFAASCMGFGHRVDPSARRAGRTLLGGSPSAKCGVGRKPAPLAQLG